MKQNIVVVNKAVGQTPLEAIELFKQHNPEYKSCKIGYAGRLDPMADGLLLLLIDGENKNKQKYLNLDKGYVVKVLFGVSTDTYDALGIVNNINSEKYPKQNDIKNYLGKIIGNIDQSPPPFSSYRIKGKPLFYYYKNNLVAPDVVPKIKRTIFEAKLKDTDLISSADLEREILRKIDLVSGDFRQEKIKESWANYFEKNIIDHYLVATCYFKVSTGTYVRSIVNLMGESLKCHAFVLSLTRTQIGDFILEAL